MVVGLNFDEQCRNSDVDAITSQYPAVVIFYKKSFAFSVQLKKLPRFCCHSEIALENRPISKVDEIFEN